MRGDPATRSRKRLFLALMALGALALAAGLGAAWVMEEHGHVVTGMNNQIVWGTPHVFAIFLIVAASGVLNVASIGTVFGEAAYKSRAALSGLLAIALLAGGLMVLMLDLGRPERLLVAATHYNFRSMFAWNVFLYTGFFAIVAAYLWVLTERRMHSWSRPVGLAAFFWRLALTTGTGLIFGFLIARQAYASGLLAPLFILMSFAWGLAVFHVAQAALDAWHGRQTGREIQRRMRNLLGVFVASVLYLVAVHHLANGYWARQAAFERFILLDGGIYPALFWIGYVAIGSILPLFLLYHPGLGGRRATLAASVFVITGAFSLLYVFIIGGQAFPLEMFPGYEARSSFGDGRIGHYAPSLPQILLGMGGVAAAFLITLLGLGLFDFAPPADDDGATSPGGAT
jgi:Ni/Fe-hydrogenase subunit HybB-like protein